MNPGSVKKRLFIFHYDFFKFYPSRCIYSKNIYLCDLKLKQ